MQCKCMINTCGRKYLLGFKLLKPSARTAAGVHQLAVGQSAGAEAAIHSMKSFFENPECEAALLLDASNAFNSLNRRLAIHNIQFICPQFVPFLRNMYGAPSALFTGTTTLFSEEGATQGDPAAFLFYGLGIMLMLDLISLEGILQLFYADDGNAAGNLEDLAKWYKLVLSIGPHFGFQVNPSKSVLIVKAEFYNRALELFSSTGVTITTEGARHLGASIGSSAFSRSFVDKEIDVWISMVNNLADIATTHPHLAYSCFTRSLKHKWAYLQRTIPDSLFDRLETAIRDKLIPKLIGRHCTDAERNLLSLPIKLGGLGIDNPCDTAAPFHANSLLISEPLVEGILQRSPTEEELWQIENSCAERRQKCETREIERKKDLATSLCTKDPSLKRTLELCTESGASAWLTARLTEALGHELNQEEFVDAIGLRYGFMIKNLPSTCECSAVNSADHCLSCPKGGFTIMRLDEVRHCFADISSHAGLRAVQTEKPLLPCDGFKLGPSVNTTKEARMDVYCVGLWGRQRAAYLDVRVFHPNAPSYKARTPADLYKNHEAMKKRDYGKRITDVEKGTFSPLVLSTSGGWAPEADRVLRTTAGIISSKHKDPYDEVINFLRTRLRICLLRSTLVALRGNRRKVHPSSMGTFDWHLAI